MTDLLKHTNHVMNVSKRVVICDKTLIIAAIVFVMYDGSFKNDTLQTSIINRLYFMKRLMSLGD